MSRKPQKTTAKKRKRGEYDIALRPFHNGEGRRQNDPTDVDDIVVNHPVMFRAEMMDDSQLWMCCYMDDTGERVNFWVSADREGHLTVSVTELPRGDYVYEPGSVGPGGPIE